MSTAATTARQRVLCVTSNFPRWEDDSTTPFVLDLAQDLAALGWQVDVLAPHAPGAAKREWLDGVSVERFRYFWPESAENVCYRGGALINIRKDRVAGLKLPALVVAEWLSVVRRLVARRYDLVHFHWILPQGFIGALSARLLGIPYVVTVHGGDIFALNGPLLRRIKRFTLAAATAVTVNSRATEKAVRALHGRHPELRCIPMGVIVREVSRESHLVQSIRCRYRRGEGPLLAFAGRLVDEKGCADLIVAVLNLVQDLPDISALVMGDGQDRPAIEAMAGRLGIAERIHFAGWVRHAEVLEHLAAADLFVGPSRTGVDGWVEAQGLAFLEAMIARTPVVASRIGGISDSVIDGETGLLVDERAPEQIAAAIKKLLANEDLRTRITENAWAHASMRFSREGSARAFSALFSDLSALRRGRSHG